MRQGWRWNPSILFHTLNVCESGVVYRRVPPICCGLQRHIRIAQLSAVDVWRTGNTSHSSTDCPVLSFHRTPSTSNSPQSTIVCSMLNHAPFQFHTYKQDFDVEFKIMPLFVRGLRFSQRYYWEFSSSDMLHCVAGPLDLWIAALKIPKTKSLVRIRPWGPSSMGSPQIYRIIKFFVGFVFRTGFRSADRGQYSGSLLWDLKVIVLIIMGQGRYRVTRKSPAGYQNQQLCVFVYLPKLKTQSLFYSQFIPFCIDDSLPIFSPLLK